MIDVFVSRPTSVENQYKAGLDGFLNVMMNLDLNPRTLGASDYPSKAPLDEVIELMLKCKGAIILGYPQINLSEPIIKGKRISGELLLPTEWNHIEAALAYSHKLPLLVIHQKGISRGIFDRGALNCFIYETDNAQNNWCIKPDITGAIKKWKTDLNNFKIVTEQLVQDNQKPFCPNCSTIEKKNYLSPITKELVEIMGANFECKQCKYLEMIK